MSLMGWMQSNKEDLDKRMEENAKEYEDLKTRT